MKEIPSAKTRPDTPQSASSFTLTSLSVTYPTTTTELRRKRELQNVKYTDAVREMESNEENLIASDYQSCSESHDLQTSVRESEHMQQSYRLRHTRKP